MFINRDTKQCNFPALLYAADGPIARADTQRWLSIPPEVRAGYLDEVRADLREFDDRREARQQMEDNERERQAIAAELGLASVPHQVEVA